MKNIPRTPAAYRAWWAENTDSPFGSCWCGCGAPTHLAKWSNTEKGWVKGQPKRYAHGHNGRLSGVEYVEENRGYSSPCWIWRRSVDHSGYGQITVQVGALKTTIKAHRLYYERAHGRIPDGFEMDHLCRVRSCVNPAHLEPVTDFENTIRGLTAKLTAEDVKAIREHGLRSRHDAAVLAKKYGVQPQYIRILVRQPQRTWREE